MRAVPEKNATAHTENVNLRPPGMNGGPSSPLTSTSKADLDGLCFLNVSLDQFFQDFIPFHFPDKAPCVIVAGDVRGIP